MGSAHCVVESFLQRKVYQIIAVMDSRGSITTASNMPILIGIPKVQTFTINITNRLVLGIINRLTG
jgi:hypothetical protein